MTPLVRILAAAAALAGSGAAQAGVIADDLARDMARRQPGERIAVIIELAGRVDLGPFEGGRDRRRRDTRLMRALKSKSEHDLAQLAPRLDEQGVSERRPLWIGNALAASVPVRAIEKLARLPGVERIGRDAVVELAASPGAGAAAASPPGWNLAVVHAPEVWALGARGEGALVANMDTGVDLDHPDLAASWRGGANSWFDPWHEYATPADPLGHGTQTMGLIVAGSASGAPTGVAPGARWIAARIFDAAGQSTLSTIHQAFQWLLDPDGDPATLDAPDVVNASWGLGGGTPGACNMEFNGDIRVLNAAGIAVVFAAGNAGPAPASAASPAANPAAFSAGAVDATLAVTAGSGRGPSGCDGAIFPKVVAPGVNVTSSDLSFGGLPLYASVSGTSFAAPHVAGAMALLAAAYPSATVADLNNALIAGAADIDAPGPDNNAGNGLLDVLAAHRLLASGNGGQHAPAITSLPATDTVENQPWQYQLAAVDADGGTLAFALAAAPAGMAIDAAGRVTWTPTHAQLGPNAVTVTVTDPTSLSAAQSFSVLVAAANTLPVAAGDSYAVAGGATLDVAAPGVLANDRDADGDRLSAQLAGAPAHGTLALGVDGALRYVPASGFAGADSFRYRASDGKGASNVATVSISVTAPPPTARNDSFSVPAWRSGAYSPRRLAVLGNDSAAAGATLAPSSVAVQGAPNRGGKAVVNSDGTLSYTPAWRFSGVETFSYKVRDSRNAWSNSATVSVTVQ